MKAEAIVKALAMLLGGALVGAPILGALGQADEVGDGVGGLLVEGLAGEPAHGGVNDDGGAGGNRLGLGGGCGSRRVWKIWRCGRRRSLGEGGGRGKTDGDGKEQHRGEAAPVAA